MAAPLSVEVEFGGGAELLFDGVKKHQVTLPGQEEPWDIRNLLVWIKKNLLKERPELFIQGDSVRKLSPRERRWLSTECTAGEEGLLAPPLPSASHRPDRCLCSHHHSLPSANFSWAVRPCPLTAHAQSTPRQPVRESKEQDPLRCLPHGRPSDLGRLFTLLLPLAPDQAPALGMRRRRVFRNRWGSHFVQETAPAVPSTSQAKRDPKMFCPGPLLGSCPPGSFSWGLVEALEPGWRPGLQGLMPPHAAPSLGPERRRKPRR
nr:ubiquitin-related modifier 1 isoform X2 [Manis javanica]